MDVCVGDRVQIVDGGMDVTNGLRAKSGKMYGEGGPLWATVVLIDTEWRTGSKFGLPSTVTKVRCTGSDGQTVVWQVRPEDIAPNIIRASKPEEVQTEPEPAEPEPEPTDEGKIDLTPREVEKYSSYKDTSATSLNAYAPAAGATRWDTGYATSSTSTGKLPSTTAVQTKLIPKESITILDSPKIPLAGSTAKWRKLTDTERKNIGTNSLEVDASALEAVQWPKAWENEGKKAEMLDNVPSLIQNAAGFPYTDRTMAPSDGSSVGSRIVTRAYDFQIIPGDTRYPKMVSLEDKLRDVRAAFGIPVHGDNNFARAMKYYMYNRFKVPDTNLLHNKSVTHVFFSRPDLNILDGRTANQQTLNHTEAAMIWRRYPEIFKLLTDCKRCGDNDNFNMLLSNQVTSFDIRDEELSTIEAGKSWGEYSMPYGDSYTGRTSGEFTCNFDETSDYSVINLIKLWITYIDNVGRGAWSPSYALRVSDGSLKTGVDASHVFTKTLDYAASVYVFKCDYKGEDILYWTKYYGVFPVSTGAGALSWNNDTPPGTAPKLSIRFKYAWKRDMSPVSLLEFNNLARITKAPVAENSFNLNYAHSSRPFVGTPFIEMYLANPILRDGGAILTGKQTTVRLKFKNTEDLALSDDALFRATFVGRGA